MELKNVPFLECERQMRSNRRNRTAQLGKDLNRWRKRKLQITGNMRSGHQANKDERKSKKGES